MPQITPEIGNNSRKARDLLISAALALVVMAVMFTVLAQTVDTSLPDFYAENSVPLAHGHNIVNVILVDFRALDTFGEIAVLAIAALGALALLRSRQMRRNDSSTEP